MKKTLFTLLAGACSFGSLSTQGREGSVIWDDDWGSLAGVPADPIVKDLTELRQEIKEYADSRQNPYIELLTLSNVVIDIDDTVLYYQRPGAEHGGPSGLVMKENVTFNILTLTPFEDTMVGASLGGFGMETYPNASLTINLTENVVNHLKWNDAFADESIMVAQIMTWSYFFDYSDWGTPTTISATYENNQAGYNLGEYVFQGYIDDLNNLEENGIAMMRTDILTDAFLEENDPWDGVTFALVARGATAPDINVPEPATGTLSLLALAGLAARRRRK